MFRSLVAPLDSTPLATKDLPYVVQIADPTSRLTLVGVAQPSFSARCAVDAELMTRRSDLLWRDAARLRSEELHVVTTVRMGSAYDDDRTPNAQLQRISDDVSQSGMP